MYILRWAYTTLSLWVLTMSGLGQYGDDGRTSNEDYSSEHSGGSTDYPSILSGTLVGASGYGPMTTQRPRLSPLQQLGVLFSLRQTWMRI